MVSFETQLVKRHRPTALDHHASQIAAAREIVDLRADEREVVATFVSQLVELVGRDSEAIRATTKRAHAPAPAPSPPRCA